MFELFVDGVVIVAEEGIVITGRLEAGPTLYPTSAEEEAFFTACFEDAPVVSPMTH